RSAVWFLNHDSPRIQARFVSVIRSPSACSSMSSQTHPQKVHVAFFTTVSCIRSIPGPAASGGLFVAVRTGRDDERSPELAAAEAPADAPRHEPPRLDLLPRRHVAAGRLLRRAFLRVVRGPIRRHV